MRPPQERPTRQAVSSATPNSSIFGVPAPITSRASSTTAPSTQPPETDPSKLPSPSTTRWLPTGRGAEPQVSTTVAMATPRPAFRQASAVASTSRSVKAASMFASSARSFRLNITTAAPAPRAGRLGGAEETARVGRSRGFSAERPAELGHRFQRMDRPKLVDMGQHRPDSARPRLESVVAEQRIEPDQPPAGAVQSVHLGCQPFLAVPFEPVAEEEDHRPLPEHPARPEAVEFVDRGADPGAAGPVRHRGRAGGERLVDIPAAQLPRHVGEPGAEQKGRDPPRPAERVDEVEEEARVLTHRPGNVAEHHDRRRYGAPPPVLQEKHIAAGAQARAKGAPEVDHSRRRR